MTDATRTRMLSVFATRVGVLAANPVLEAAEAWGPQGDVSALKVWLRDPVTQRVLSLVKELAINPPSGVVSLDKLENYGLTSGLQLAARVMEDPTILFPQVFESSEQTALPEPDYSTSV